MEKNKPITLIEAIILLAAVVLVGWCFYPVNDHALETLIKLFEKWQTLVAGIFAIIAACIAAIPVWRQLKILEKQSSTASREVLTKLLFELEKRKSETRDIISKMTREFSRAIYPRGYEWEGGKPEINYHWAYSAESEVGRVLSIIRETQERKQDCNIVQDAREGLISSLNDLQECLYEINAPNYVDMDEELNLTEEDREKINQDSEKAEARLPSLIEKVSESSWDFDLLPVN